MGQNPMIDQITYVVFHLVGLMLGVFVLLLLMGICIKMITSLFHTK